MYLIAGLGNPGKEYTKTRHNIGFLAVDSIHKHWGCDPFQYKKEWNGLWKKTTRGDNDVFLLKPETFMNLSGESIQAMSHYFHIPTDHIIVIHDDIDLPLGKIRIVFNSASGGQKGVESIIHHIGKEHIRIKIGVSDESRKQQDTASYVLSSFSKQEEESIQSTLDLMPTIVETIIQKGFAPAQNLYN